ncbi:MAG: FAD binding domain-containing protein [Anaerolineae bacterium]
MTKNNQALSANPAGLARVWSMDAEAPLQMVLDRPDTSPLLRQTLTGVLSWQTRDETPVRRALTSPRIAPQWVAALLALGATVTMDRENESAEVPLEALLQRKVEGKVSTLHVGVGRLRWSEAHVSRTPADEPIVAAIAVVKMDGDIVHQARVALTGVWPEPVRLAETPGQLVGGPLSEASIRAVAEAVREEVEPKGDFHGSEEYRRAMASVLTRRALQACLDQEEGDE